MCESPEWTSFSSNGAGAVFIQFIVDSSVCGPSTEPMNVSIVERLVSERWSGPAQTARIPDSVVAAAYRLFEQTIHIALVSCVDLQQSPQPHNPGPVNVGKQK